MHLPLNLLPGMKRIALPVVFFFLASALSPAQQQPRNQHSAGSIRSVAEIVNLYAIVQGHRGKLIRDLSQDDFDLTDEDNPQRIKFFSRETDMPMSLGIALDTSNSQAALLKTEQDAADAFLHSILQTGDQAFVMSFDADVRLLHDFTSARDELAQAIDSAEINETGKSILQVNPASSTGGTHLYDAVYLASNELLKARHGREVLVLVTDGEDQGSKVDLARAIEAADKANVIVYAIVVSDPEFYSLMGTAYHGDSHVRTLARATGGRTIRVASGKAIGEAFAQIQQELRSQYRLGYSPSDLRHDGSFRRIRLRVRKQNFTIRTRAGYYDVAP
jgi:VWFA-related protein